jgi:hypothetical protein
VPQRTEFASTKEKERKKQPVAPPDVPPYREAISGREQELDQERANSRTPGAVAFFVGRFAQNPTASSCAREFKLSPRKDKTALVPSWRLMGGSQSSSRVRAARRRCSPRVLHQPYEHPAAVRRIRFGQPQSDRYSGSVAQKRSRLFERVY